MIPQCMLALVAISCESLVYKIDGSKLVVPDVPEIDVVKIIGRSLIDTLRLYIM
jgi:hypothetical protein